MSKLPSKSKDSRRRRGRRLRLELLEGRLLLAGIPLGDAAAEISGAVWHDFNGNGSRQIEDSGVGGRIVFLDDNTNGQLDFTEHHTRTDINGEFEFRGLPAGTYLVSLVTPAGWEATYPSGQTHTVEVSPDGNGERVEFGTQRVWGSVLGLVWNDTDGDGEQDTDEGGVKGWPVFLDGNANGELDQGEELTISGDHGHFQFHDLESGDYDITLLPREGWSHSRPTSGSQRVHLGRGELRTGVTLASQPIWGIVEGTVRGEPNGEGSGLTGLEGWTVFLDANANGELDDDEQTTTTNEAGRFRFTEVDGGRYSLTLQVSQPWSVVTPEGENSIEIDVENGYITANQQFVVERVSGGITGLVWHDDNTNGDQEDVEPGLANWVVFLDANENGALDEGETHTESDELGRYAFDSLAAGTYRVLQVLQDGWHETVANLGNKLVELAKGQIASEIDFSNDRQWGGVQGVVWQDQNHDAKRDDEESPLVGWVVFLDTNENGKLDEGEQETRTDGNGSYGFDELEAGTYRIEQVVNRPWRQSYPRRGGHSVEVAYETIEKVDFGNYTFTNPGQPLDVNGDGHITPADALIIINELNNNGSHGLSGEGEGGSSTEYYIDTNGDGLVTPVDALTIINHLNDYGGVQSEGDSGPEGEAGPEGESAPSATQADTASRNLLGAPLVRRETDKKETQSSQDLPALLFEQAAEADDSWTTPVETLALESRREVAATEVDKALEEILQDLDD